ncbi:hypothetical protein NKR23_g8343 [Pleurostoma richardsiae]|uniref:Uncharacterized protein n=1 Tax=Pleurostoma richardsiae TaxID=41990 RepID=A0AA38R9D0_9PEZI|nr:hypothetical protein NKR23_g8343 [Pleurostoma richardsiae]
MPPPNSPDDDHNHEGTLPRVGRPWELPPPRDQIIGGYGLHIRAHRPHPRQLIRDDENSSQSSMLAEPGSANSRSQSPLVPVGQQGTVSRPLRAQLESLIAEAAASSASPTAEAVAAIDWQILEYTDSVDENLICPICRTPFDDPHTTKACGHTFCKACLRQALSIRGACPICRTEIDLHSRHAITPCPRIVHALLDKLKVKCPNTSLCEWVDCRDLLKQHIDHCPWTMLDCPEDSCDKKVIRADANKGCLHYDAPCLFCKEPVERAKLEEHCRTVCEGFHHKCTACNAPVVRSKMATHDIECQEVEVPCAYAASGCTTRCRRIEMVAHEEVCHHGTFKRLEDRHRREMDQARDRIMQEMDQAMQRKEQQIKAQIDHNITGMLRGVEEQVVQHITERLEQQYPFLSNLGLRPVLSSPSHSNQATNGSVAAASSSGADVGTSGSSTSQQHHCENCDARDEYMFKTFADLEARINTVVGLVTELDGHHSAMLRAAIGPIKEQLIDFRSQYGVMNMHIRWLLDIQRLKRAADRQTLNGAAAAAADAVAASSSTQTRPSANAGDSETPSARITRWMGDRSNNHPRPPRL